MWRGWGGGMGMGRAVMGVCVGEGGRSMDGRLRRKCDRRETTDGGWGGMCGGGSVGQGKKFGGGGHRRCLMGLNEGRGWTGAAGECGDDSG